MTHKKRILIVSLAAGSGHIQTAKALKKTADLYFPDIECRHIDMTEYITPLLKRAAVSGYGFLIAHVPHIWKSLYKLTDNRRIVKAYRVLTDYLKMLNSFDFLNEVYAFKPDVIVCTHFVPAEILAHAQKKTGGMAPIIEIITDYGIHPMWTVPGVDQFIVSTPEMKEELVREFHITPEHIQMFGIPIDPAFEKKAHISTLKSKYQLPLTQPVILVLSGGNGSIEISKILSELFSKITFPISILAVAGNNTKLYSQIKTLTPPSHITYRPFGWTDEIPQMMRIADMVVGKPGGLTTTECIASGVPLIAVNPIPGQEENNVIFLEKNRMGSLAKKMKDIVPLITYYLSNNHTKKDCTPVQSGKKILNFISLS